MAVEDEMIECSISSLTLDTKSQDTNMSESNWNSRLIENALLDSTMLNNSSSAVKEDGSLRGKMKRIVIEEAKQKYNDDMIEIADSVGDLVFPTFAVESSSEDIFKVWDLECSVGEGELVKQLNKALSASFIQTNQRSDDSLVRVGLNEQSVNHLTMGVADLSLNKGFGRLDCLTSGIADMSLDQYSGPKLPS